MKRRWCLPRLCETSQTAKDDYTENTRSTAQQPVCDALGGCLGEAARLALSLAHSFRQYRPSCIRPLYGCGTAERLSGFPSHRLQDGGPG
jgi:hypothetical protein